MLNEQTHNLESDPELEQKAKEYELSLVNKRIKDFHSSEIQKLSTPGLVFTPSEHKLIGSSSYGLGFSPNKPYAVFAKKSLDDINLKREELSEQDLQLPMPISIGGKKLLPIVKLLPLEEKMVAQGIPQQTFEIKHFTELSGNKIEADQANIENAEAEILKMLLEAQKKEQELYFNKINV